MYTGAKGSATVDDKRWIGLVLSLWRSLSASTAGHARVIAVSTMSTSSFLRHRRSHATLLARGRNSATGHTVAPDRTRCSAVTCWA